MSEKENMGTLIVYKDWLEAIESMPIDVQDKIIADFVRYGLQMDLQHTDDSTVFSFVNLLKGRIDANITSYLNKVNMSKSGGRKKKINSEEVYKLGKEGKTSQEIADLLGCSKSAIDHDEGWKQRKNTEFVF